MPRVVVRLEAQVLPGQQMGRALHYLRRRRRRRRLPGRRLRLHPTVAAGKERVGGQQVGVTMGRHQCQNWGRATRRLPRTWEWMFAWDATCQEGRRAWQLARQAWPKAGEAYVSERASWGMGALPLKEGVVPPLGQ
jgi:hypothetical protein